MNSVDKITSLHNLAHTQLEKFLDPTGGVSMPPEERQKLRHECYEHLKKIIDNITSICISDLAFYEILGECE